MSMVKLSILIGKRGRRTEPDGVGGSKCHSCHVRFCFTIDRHTLV